MKLSSFFIACFCTIVAVSGRANMNYKPGDSTTVDSLLHECAKLEFSHPDSSRILTEKTINIAWESGYLKGFGLAILQKGYLLEDVGEYDEAELLYDSSIAIFERINDTWGIAKSRNTLGVLQNYQGKYEKAIINLQSAYENYSKINHIGGQAITLGNMGLVQNNNGNFDDALRYYNQSLTIKKELNDSLGMAIDEMNIGNVYFSKREYEKSLEHYFTSIELSKLIDDKIGIGFCLTAIGNVQNAQEEYNLAEENFLYALDIQNSIHDKNGLADTYKGLGITYIKLNQNEKAIAALSKGLELAKELKITPVIQEIYSSISDAYKQTKDFDKALEYYTLHTKLKDSIFNANKIKQIAELETKYQSKLKDREITDKEAEIFAKEEEIDTIIREDNFKMIVFSVVIFAILSIALVIFYNLRKKKKLVNELEKLSIVAREIENTVIIANKEGVIEWINKSYTRKTGYDIDEFKKKYGNYITNESDYPEIQRIIEQCKRDKKPTKYSIELTNKNGNKSWVQTTLTPILDDHGDIKKFVLIDSDITDVKRTEEKVAIQRDQLIAKNNLITESIDYAKRIQSALLPSQQKIKSNFSDHFIYYQAKDIVSGDFYWVENIAKERFPHLQNDVILFAAADCTGHGVPGALMSIIGMNALNNITDKGITEPHLILEELSDQIQEKLTHQDHTEQLKDGIDISLCSFQFSKDESQLGILQFSGAHNPLYLVRNNELTEYRGDRIHIGINRREGKSFKQQTIQIQEGDIVYLFSDGFSDQKGGPDGKKFYYAPFRELLVNINKLPMEEQNKILHETMINWKKEKEQLDDILVMGIKF